MNASIRTKMMLSTFSLLLECRAAGGTDNGAPGERAYVKGYYAAYILDPMGNNIEVVYWSPLWLKALKSAPMIISGLLGASLTVAYSWYSK
jgi:hypothetical protein